MTQYNSETFEWEKFWYKKCFVDNRNDSSMHSIKLEAYELLMIKKGLDLTFSIV